MAAPQMYAAFFVFHRLSLAAGQWRRIRPPFITPTTPHARFIRALFALAALLFSLAAGAENVSVAVAANFSAPMNKIAELFSRDSGHTVTLSYGSSGKFFAQISHGAPFELFLSADQGKPRTLVEAGLAVRSSGFTYARGALVLWSADPALVKGKQTLLQRPPVDNLAIANPHLAPYGRAAIEALDSLGLKGDLAGGLVQGENIAQAYQFVASGNAPLGLVARSQVYADGALTHGSGWSVPAALHGPINQDAVLLHKGKGNPAALALLAYLKSAQARAVIEAFGYQVPGDGTVE